MTLIEFSAIFGPLATLGFGWWLARDKNKADIRHKNSETDAKIQNYYKTAIDDLIKENNELMDCITKDREAHKKEVLELTDFYKTQIQEYIDNMKGMQKMINELQEEISNLKKQQS